MILKVYWKGDIRRLPVLNPDESLDDMIRRIRRVFSIPYEEDITLTYCDQDDDDLRLASSDTSTLKIRVRPTKENTTESLHHAQFARLFEELVPLANDFSKSLQLMSTFIKAGQMKSEGQTKLPCLQKQQLVKSGSIGPSDNGNQDSKSQAQSEHRGQTNKAVPTDELDPLRLVTSQQQVRAEEEIEYRSPSYCEISQVIPQYQQPQQQRLQQQQTVSSQNNVLSQPVAYSQNTSQSMHPQAAQSGPYIPQPRATHYGFPVVSQPPMSYAQPHATYNEQVGPQLRQRQQPLHPRHAT